MKTDKIIAYEWHNHETGHCYVDYVPHPEQDEKDGYTKTALCAARQSNLPTDEEIHNAYVNYQWALGAPDKYHDGLEDGFKAGAEWLRKQITDKQNEQRH